MLTNRIYYHLKPFIPRIMQIFLRRWIIVGKKAQCKDIWPIDEEAGRAPVGWFGWPEQRRIALVLTHDVDTAIGQEKCRQLMEKEEQLGFRSSFNFVPERYEVSSELRHNLTKRGFEVGVHGLNHDGKLFQSKKIFLERSHKINQYLKEWNAVGFRSPAMHHNLEWIPHLNVEYDSSTFDTDPFEPQSDGIATIFPFWIGYANTNNPRGYVELPYTLPQDFTLFVLMKERNIGIWTKKLDWIFDKGGMALLNTHPDYMSFNGKISRREEYPVEYYLEFLEHIKVRFDKLYWHVLPMQLARFWASLPLTASLHYCRWADDSVLDKKRSHER